jgi:hypothetical protein
MRRALVPILILLAASIAHAGDLTIRQRTMLGGVAPRDETQYAHDALLVIDATDTRTIVDVDARTMKVADKRTRTWFELTFDDLRRQADAVQRRARAMPPKERKMLDELLGGNGAVTLEPTGRKAKIAGFQATEQALKGGPFAGSIWATDAVAVPEGVRRWRELSADSTSAAGPARPLTQALAQVRGLPLRTSMTANIGGTTFATSTEVLEVRKSTIPRDVLQVPAGFTRVPAPAIE